MAGEIKEMHECTSTTRQETIATIEKPYHYIDSGLPNIYLVGVRQFQCECGEKAVEIPAIKQLMSLIARNLAMKNESLTGLEIKFLRKQLGQKANDFAEHIKVQPETLSRIENEKQPVGEKTDVYIRIYYALESKDPVLVDTLKSALDRVLSAHRSKPPKKPPKTVATIEHDEWALAAGAGR
jgi:DNA-binding transcriptional regulator YiaG